VGKELVIAGLTFTVVGVKAEGDDSDVMRAMSSMSGGNSAGTIIIPYPAALRMTGTGAVNSLTLYIADTDKTDAAIDRLEERLNSIFNYRDSAFTILNLDSLLDTMDTITDMMTTLLAGIASIALVVGGIGIMNMMLTSVTERTTEIGLKKALGAMPWQIQTQFLIESFLLSMLGGLLGVAAGLALSAVLCRLLGTSFVLSVTSITLGVGFSAAVGILFGWAPARKASRLNPIDALRSM